MGKSLSFAMPQKQTYQKWSASVMAIKKCFLIFSFFSVSSIALLYGINPHWFASTFLGVKELDLNLAHILRAVMGLYLALGLFWFVSAFSATHRNTAILTLMIFSAGLLAGRMISFFTDGSPAPLLQLYTAIEASLLPVAYWVYKRKE
jgi:hypothetical protein